MIRDVSPLLAFCAGLLSFLSPCVFPLLPSYFSILAGTGFDRAVAPGNVPGSRLFRASLAFTTGFSVIFILLGVLVNTVFFFGQGISSFITIVSGLVVIILGFNVIFDFLSFLNYEKRPFLKPGAKAARGVVPAFLGGMAFAAGWTPCVGPVLTGILLMAGQSRTTGQAVLCLVCYSAGLSLPFILGALFFDFFYCRVLRRVGKSGLVLVVLRYISAGLLIAIGIMILLGKYSGLNSQIQGLMADYIAWAKDKALPLRGLARFFIWIKQF